MEKHILSLDIKIQFHKDMDSVNSYIILCQNNFLESQTNEFCCFMGQEPWKNSQMEWVPLVSPEDRIGKTTGKDCLHILCYL